MKIHKLVDVLGAINDTGKLACDMYDLGKKHYYSEARGYKMPISEMDFQHMVRAFVKLCEQEEMLDRSEHMGTTKDLQKHIKCQDDIIKSLHKKLKKLREDLEGGFKQSVDDLDSLEAQEKIIAGLRSQVETLRGIIDEKDEQLNEYACKITNSVNIINSLREDTQTQGHRYVFSEIPNNEYGKKLTRGMKVYLNNESYTMRVRGQHLKPELHGQGKASYGQSIEDSTHLRVYIDTKKGDE
tara:strand:- start:74 stop:796 length:723 start_codon:yes stop_codon:yes gene_type:complete